MSKLLKDIYEVDYCYNRLTKHKCTYENPDTGERWCRTYDDGGDPNGRCPETGAGVLIEDRPNAECGWMD